MNIRAFVERRFGEYMGLPKAIYIIFVVRIVNAMGNFVYPFLTFFLTQKIGFSASEASNFFMLSSILSMLGSIVGGKLADNFGRKKLMLMLQGAAGLIFAVCGFLDNSILIPILLAFAGMFNGAAQPANSAMVADLTNKENRKPAMSLLYLGINIGFSFGPAIGQFLYRSYPSMIFFGNAGSIFITLLLVALFVKETAPTEEEVEEGMKLNDDEAAESSNILISFKKRPTLLLFLVGKTVNQLVYSVIGFAIPIQMARTFGETMGTEYYGYVLMWTGIVVITFTIPIIKLTNKIRPIVNIALAGVFYAVGFGMIGIISNFWLFMLSGFIFTIGEILEATNAGVYIANHSPMNQRGRFNSIIPMITGMGSTFGPKIFGITIDTIGIYSVWVMCFVLAMMSSVFMLWLRLFEDKWHEKKYGRAL